MMPDEQNNTEHVYTVMFTNWTHHHHHRHHRLGCTNLVHTTVYGKI